MSGKGPLGPSVRATRIFLIILGSIFAFAIYAVSREPERTTPYAIPFCVLMSAFFLGVGAFGSDRWVLRLGRWIPW